MNSYFRVINMSEHMNEKLHKFKKVFLILLIFDLIELIQSGVNMLPSFMELEEYGQMVMIVSIVITGLVAVILLFEIFTKLYLMRSTSQTFSWESGRKGYVAAAKLLLVFNLGVVLVNVLSMGGEGATLLNQMNLYLHVIADIVETIAIILYLRKVKRLKESKE